MSTNTKAVGEEDEHRVSMGLRSHQNNTTQTQDLFNHIRRAIITAKEHKYLVFEEIDPDIGSQIVASLDADGEVEPVGLRITFNSLHRVLEINIMPTWVHDVLQCWLNQEYVRMGITGFITLNESQSLIVASGTSCDNFVAQYAGSVKQPDWMAVPVGFNMPTIVAESGWSDSWPGLHRDMTLWLKGSPQTMSLVFLVKWSKVAGGRVEGSIEVWDLDSTGNEHLLQTEVSQKALYN
ncbi:hypothetical protein PRK78_000005 [Emydomyces testavorans]|uniref:Uncharacterized protein n=1 Tax=Emydomyces testavorans TaxID=2070801 RepID=A0AAF0DAE1_9EURO|nr:hypothetical protein PRK78_000005 [Emydomyces testavorans]